MTVRVVRPLPDLVRLRRRERDIYGNGHVRRSWAPNGSEFTYEDIWDSWRAFNYTFYVVYPPEEEQVVFDIVGEELLDEQRMWQKTIEVANRDIAANPEDPFAWFNLGTAYTELGRLNGQQVDYQQVPLHLIGRDHRFAATHAMVSIPALSGLLQSRPNAGCD